MSFFSRGVNPTASAGAGSLASRLFLLRESGSNNVLGTPIHRADLAGRGGMVLARVEEARRVTERRR